MIITNETVLAKIAQAGKEGYRPTGGEAKFIFALSNGGAIKTITRKTPTGGAHFRYVLPA